MIYIVIAVILFAFSIIIQFKKDFINSPFYYLFYYLSFFILFCFTAFRYEIGCDWFNYEGMFGAARKVELSTILIKRDSLYWLLMKTAHYFNLPYPSINFFTSLLFFVGIHVLAKRQPNPLAFLVFIYPILIVNMPMSAVRQSAAIGMICLALVAIIEKRPKWFLLWVMIATGFHISAAPFLALFPFSSGKYTLSSILKSGLLFVPIFYFLINSNTGEHITNVYVVTPREAHGAIYRIGLLIITSVFFLLVLKNKWKKQFLEDYDLILLSSLAMILLIFLIPISTVITDRYGYYFIVMQAIILARIPFLQFQYQSNYIFYSLLPYAILTLFFLIWIMNSWLFDKCYLPYKNLIFNFF